jgi:rhamnopyranosyl-N-acetylglucosaminyl-diphospho-decaprenol beta-1,3/1,4-galactofuranosyltransferase
MQHHLAGGLPAVGAVIVTCDRPRQLERLLGALDGQTIRPAFAIVVDNGTCPRTPGLCRSHGAVHIRSAVNLGGAGGFSLGMLTALARGAEYVWLWDDDGWPGEDACLERLLRFQRGAGLTIASPLVLDEEDPGHCAFAFRMGGRSLRTRREVEAQAAAQGFVPDAVHLFNGALLPAEALFRHGVPDLRLFVRGDEVDFMLRVRRGGGRIATLLSATARHPSGQGETHHVLGPHLAALYPPDATKRAMLFRNRGFLAREHRRWHVLAVEAVLYAVFFLGRRRPDWRGLGGWAAATWAGLRGRLGRPGPVPAPAPPRPPLIQQPSVVESHSA